MPTGVYERKPFTAEHRTRIRDAQIGDQNSNYKGVRALRDPVKIRARRVIQYHVSVGNLPRAETLECHDCGGQAEGYDHFAGYEGIFKYFIEPVCNQCNIDRARPL